MQLNGKLINKLTRINDIILYLLKKNNIKINLIPKYFNKKTFILGNNRFAKKILKWRIKKNIYTAVDEIYNSLQL